MTIFFGIMTVILLITTAIFMCLWIHELTKRKHREYTDFVSH